MELTFITSQIVSAAQVICNALSVQLKRRSQIILLMVVGGVLLCVVQWLLGRYAGLVLAGIGTLISVAAYFLSLRNKVMSKWAIGIVAALLVAVCIYFWQDWFDILVLCSQLAFLIEMSAKTEQGLRSFALINLLFWIIYNALTGGYILIIGNIIMIVSTVIALIRYRKVKRGKAKNN